MFELRTLHSGYEARLVVLIIIGVINGMKQSFMRDEHPFLQCQFHFDLKAYSNQSTAILGFLHLLRRHGVHIVLRPIARAQDGAAE
jgi:hypothetical protein